MNKLINLTALVILLLTISCNWQKLKKDDFKIDKAKWYFYCYGSNLNVYKNTTEISTLECEVINIGVKTISKDTVNYFFKYQYKNDTLNNLSTKPLEIIGVKSINDSLYLPIFNHIKLEELITSHQILNMMQTSKTKFIEKVNNTTLVNGWSKINYSNYH